MSRVLTCVLATALLAGSELAAQSMPGSTIGNQAAFGRAVAVVGTDVLVGEPSNETKSGLVYVYRKAAAKWAEATVVSARDAEVSDGFGTTIDQTVIADAPLERDVHTLPRPHRDRYVGHLCNARCPGTRGIDDQRSFNIERPRMQQVEYTNPGDITTMAQQFHHLGVRKQLRAVLFRIESIQGRQPEDIATPFIERHSARNFRSQPRLDGVRFSAG